MKIVCVDQCDGVVSVLDGADKASLPEGKSVKIWRGIETTYGKAPGWPPGGTVSTTNVPRDPAGGGAVTGAPEPILMVTGSVYGRSY